MAPERPLKLAVTVDVEEEGLFVGRFPKEAAGVRNVACLSRVEFIPRDFGLPLTLLTTYQVAREPAAVWVLRDFRDRFGAEIGAHLHPWNTPPFLPGPEPLRSEALPRELLAAKLASLLNTLKGAGFPAPVSFRMGRFDWGPKILSLLPEFSLRVDSSMVPLTQVVGGPDHFLAPPDPFWPADSRGRPLGVLEVPLTLVPLWPQAAEAVYRLSSRARGRAAHLLRAWFPYVLSAGVQPVWFPLPWMRLAARLHAARGGQLLCLFFHSSELMPGGTPHTAREAAVARLVGKIRAFLAWLTRRFRITGVTLGALGHNPPAPGEARTPLWPVAGRFGGQ
ncbi:MAG: hypothetical protein K6T55_06510 [Syntrophobacterales bacterium]|nr:hypothetical protein [Syntrophobacterales bacterium]